MWPDDPELRNAAGASMTPPGNTCRRGSSRPEPGAAPMPGSSPATWPSPDGPPGWRRSTRCASTRTTAARGSGEGSRSGSGARRPFGRDDHPVVGPGRALPPLRLRRGRREDLPRRGTVGGASPGDSPRPRDAAASGSAAAHPGGAPAGVAARCGRGRRLAFPDRPRVLAPGPGLSDLPAVL